MDTEALTPFKSRWYFSVAAVLLIFVVVAIYSSRVAHFTTGYDDDQAKDRYAKLAKMRETDRKTLTTADWVDQTKGTVRIPIDEAMIEEVGTLQAKPVAVGTAIPGAAATTMNTIPATSVPPGSSTPNATGVPAENAEPTDTGRQRVLSPAPAATTNAAPTGAAPPPANQKPTK